MYDGLFGGIQSRSGDELTWSLHCVSPYFETVIEQLFRLG